MSTGLIILIIIVVLVLLALLFFVLPRARRQRELKARERELEQRRERVAEEHRTEAEERRGMAERAEQKAHMAEAEAQRERAEAELREQRAQMHERGMADDELIDESERDRFAGVAGPGTGRETDATDTPSTTADTDRDGNTVDDRAREVTDHDRQEGSTSAEYDQGREDERRFERNRVTDDVSESDRSRNA
jgi:FtsZ-interacting cell division protein ZipA